VPRLTIVNDYAWDTQHFFHSCKSIDNIVRVSEITCNVQLIVRAVCLPRWPGCEGNLIAFRGKDPSDCLADIGPCAEDEDDGRCAGHDSGCREKLGDVPLSKEPLPAI
jgi:hypothetical protein